MVDVWADGGAVGRGGPTDSAVTTGSAWLSTCAISDALDELGLGPAAAGLRPFGPTETVLGPAFTCRLVEGGSGAFNSYLPHVPPGSMIVVDAGGRADVSAWGGLAAAEARRLGAVGTVINGACRDAGELLDLAYPVFALGTTPASGRGRLLPAEEQLEIEILGVSIRPGDLVVADGDGFVAVPRNRSREVLRLARTITAADEALMAAVRGGAPLRDARARAIRRRGR